MNHLADAYTVVAESADPKNIFCFSPGLLRLASGRLIATMDWGGPGVRNMPDACSLPHNRERFLRGEIFLSDDGGQTWRSAAAVPMLYMRPFAAGDAVCILGACGDLGILRSEDGGETWSDVRWLTKGQIWHQAPCNVWYEKDHVYLVMERMTHQREGWPVCGIAPVLMRGNVRRDLTDPASWTFASELVFDEHVDEKHLREFGIPFYPNIPGVHAGGSSCGWLETNVVRLMKENDLLYDKTGRTLHLFMRAWTGVSWTGALAKVIEKTDGSMETVFETAPSGKRMLYIPIPGGGMSKFHILYDEQTKTYWLLSNQVIDSMVDFSRMNWHEKRGYDRSRLVLHYSHNCFDWIFAGVVAAGRSIRQARSYASMQIAGEDLLILARSGDENALSGHDTNRITFHRVLNFRSLIDTEYPE